MLVIKIGIVAKPVTMLVTVIVPRAPAAGGALRSGKLLSACVFLVYVLERGIGVGFRVNLGLGLAGRERGGCRVVLHGLVGDGCAGVFV